MGPFAVERPNHHGASACGTQAHATECAGGSFVIAEGGGYDAVSPHAGEFFTDANGFNSVTSTINLFIANRLQTKTAGHISRIAILKTFKISQMAMLNFDSEEPVSGRRLQFFLQHEHIHKIRIRRESADGYSIRRIGYPDTPHSLSLAKAFSRVSVQRCGAEKQRELPGLPCAGSWRQLLAIARQGGHPAIDQKAATLATSE